MLFGGLGAIGGKVYGGAYFSDPFYQINVANLGLVPLSGATVVVAPIKLENGSGGPARLLALVK